jgi:hypothetical protein
MPSESSESPRLRAGQSRPALFSSSKESAPGAGHKKRADPPDESRGSFVLVENLFPK